MFFKIYFQSPESDHEHGSLTTNSGLGQFSKQGVTGVCRPSPTANAILMSIRSQVLFWTRVDDLFRFITLMRRAKSPAFARVMAIQVK